MPEVVCNTSPIQYLHQAGLLWLLPALYGWVLVPGAVADELRAGLARGVDLPEPATLDWLEIRAIADSPWPLPRDIHRGEAEVVALARSLPDARVILDDLAARRHAELEGVSCTGTLGILLQSKQKGMIESVSSAVDRIERAGFRLASVTRDEILKLAGEAPR